MFYGLFLMFYKSAGSFSGDEATYAEIAREGLFSHHFFALSLNNVGWFEKPPLLIWLTELSFKSFGISEFSARFSPGVFGISSAVVLYFLGKELFGRKIFGFLAGFIFLTTPVILFYSRSTMMDIPVGFFLSLSALAVWKIGGGERRWWVVFGIATGLAVMMKSVIGLLPFFFLTPLIFFWKQRNILKDRFSLWGTGLFFLVSAPWHIFMTLRFGWVFWREYLGFQVFKRATQSIFSVPWQGNSNGDYLELFFDRSGLWFFVLLVFLAIIAGLWIFQSLHLAKNERQNTFLSWVTTNKKGFVFLLCWTGVVLIPFLFAKTKLPQYMVLAYYPLSLFVGGCIGYLVQEKKRLALFILASLSLLNFLPFFLSRVFIFGEAQFLSAKIWEYFFQRNASQSIMIASIVLLFFASVFIEQKWKSLFIGLMLFVILTGNMLVPAYPERNADVKKIGDYLTALSQDHSVTVYYRVVPEFYSFPAVITFYIPLESKVESGQGKNVGILPKDTADSSVWCYADRTLASDEEILQAVFVTSRGIVDKCSLSL